jgi:hypothetical protein
MGLDIMLCVDNEEALWGTTPDWQAYLQQNSLSRAFCNLMFHRLVNGQQPLLDQLEELVGVTLAPLYEMTTYPDAENVAWQLQQAKTVKERQQVQREAEEAKASLNNNLDRVQATVVDLLSGLARIDNLLQQLDTSRYAPTRYFASFHSKTDPAAHDYKYQSFEQDLHTLHRFLAFARSHGSRTVYFQFG